MLELKRALHDRGRDAQHAAGRAHLGPHRVHAARARWSSTTTRGAAVHAARARSSPRTTSPAGSAEARAAPRQPGHTLCSGSPAFRGQEPCSGISNEQIAQLQQRAAGHERPGGGHHRARRCESLKRRDRTLAEEVFADDQRDRPARDRHRGALRPPAGAAAAAGARPAVHHRGAQDLERPGARRRSRREHRRLRQEARRAQPPVRPLVDIAALAELADRRCCATRWTRSCARDAESARAPGAARRRGGRSSTARSSRELLTT